jgi:hypothetical protein
VYVKFERRHCEEPTGPAFGGPDDKLRDEAIQSCFARRDGLLRGACHRAALRADPLVRNDGLKIESVVH